jgi:phage tail tape-measure protein
MASDEARQMAADAGKTAGIFASMLSGARLGNMAIPVPVLGTFVGGVVGGVVGSELGQRLGKAIVSGGTAFVETLVKPQQA